MDTSERDLRGDPAVPNREIVGTRDPHSSAASSADPLPSEIDPKGGDAHEHADMHVRTTNVLKPELPGPHVTAGAPHPAEQHAARICEALSAIIDEQPFAAAGSLAAERIVKEGLLAYALAAADPALRTLSQPEVCICAAVQTKEGLVIHGHRHHDALYAAKQAFCTSKRGEDGQGFVTSTGRYVTREEGYQLQIAADIGSKALGGYRGQRLFSEDLY